MKTKATVAPTAMYDYLQESLCRCKALGHYRAGFQHFYVNNSICEYPLSHDVFREVFFAKLPKIITCLLTFSHLSDTVAI